MDHKLGRSHCGSIRQFLWVSKANPIDRVEELALLDSMVSVVIPALNSVRDLQPLLAALVPAAVEGVVREVLVADGGSTDETAALCEDAGALLLNGGLHDAAAVAKGAQVLVLTPDMRLPHDWVRNLSEHVKAGGGDGVLQPHRRGLRLFQGLAATPGLLMSRISVLEHGREGIKGLRRRLRQPVRIA